MKAKKWIALGLTMALTMGLAACGSNGDNGLVEIGKDQDKITITEAELDHTVALNAYLQAGLTDLTQLGDSLNSIRSNILENMIDGDLAKLYYAGKEDEILTDEFNENKTAAIEEFKTSTQGALFMKDSGITDETLEEYLVQNAYIMALYKEVQEGLTGQTEEQVTASHILLKTDQYPDDEEKNKEDNEARKQKADELYQQLQGGADFAELAKANSDDGSAVSGGALGTFGKGAMVPEFEDAAFSTSPGSFSKPFKSQYGYHIVYVEKKEDVPYEQLDDQSKSTVANSALVKKMAELRKQFGVKYLDKDLEKAAKDSESGTSSN